MSLREKKKKKTQQAILKATRTLIERDQIASLTTRLIAETADVSYQTLYKYYPSKNDILIALLKEKKASAEEDYQRIIRTFSGDVIDSLKQLNQSRLDFAMGYRDPIEDYLNITMKILTTTNQKFNLIELLDQFGGEQYQAILVLARGMGVIHEDTDIQLMPKTPNKFTTSGMKALFTPQNTKHDSIFLEILNQQTEQLTKPYLLRNPN